MQNENQKNRKKILIVVLAAFFIFISIFIFVLLTRNKTTNPALDTTKTIEFNSVITDTAWGVQLPSTRVGALSTDIDSATGPTVFTVPGSGAQVEQQFIIVRGLSKTENLCTLPFAASAIYRHKDENPGIDYSTAFNLNKVAVQKVKVGDWWYSTSSIITDGECFPGGLSQSKDYIKLANQYFEDFSKIKTLEN